MPNKAKHFTSSDWDGFAGAEPFADGLDPAIREIGDYIVIADGLGVSAYDEEGGWFCPRYKPYLPTGAAGLDYLNALTEDDLILFERMN